jgi:hypothetical protein
MLPASLTPVEIFTTNVIATNVNLSGQFAAGVVDTGGAP